MGKSLLFKLFKLGALPVGVRSKLESEGITAIEEGIGATLSAGKLKGPGRRHFRRKTRFPACIVVTKKRIAVYAFRNREIINIPAEKINPDNFRADVLDGRGLIIWFESSFFVSGWIGIVQIRFKTRGGRVLFEAIRSLRDKSACPPISG